MPFWDNPEKKIDKLTSEKKWEELFSYCQKYEPQYPGDTLGLYACATALREMKRNEEAVQYYKEVLKEIPSKNHSLFSSCAVVIGDFLFEISRNEEAFQYFDLAIEKDPSNLSALIAKAESLDHIGFQEEAMLCWNIVLAKNPTNFLALKGKAMSFDLTNQPEEALKYCEKALKLEPSNPALIEFRNSILNDLE